MKIKLLNTLTAGILFLIPNLNFGQTINLGTASKYVLFSTNGQVSNSGISQLTGNVGTANGSSITFGNVNGGMHDGDSLSQKCAADLLSAYNQLNSSIPTFSKASPLGNGDTLIAGIYALSAATVLDLNLYLDAKGNSNAVFIFKIQGTFSASPNSKVKLINGALACNVFWKVEGEVNLYTGVSMKGNVIANNAAIHLNTGDTLEGRALTTGGAITVDGVLGYTPIGCGSPLLTGPSAPNLVSTACYAIFSGNDAVTNTGITHVTGDIGTNVGLTTGYSSLTVTGTIHPNPDASTNACAAELGNVYTYLNTLAADIELLYPVQFGNNLVLTPHTYILKAATVFTDTLYLDAQNYPNAVFVIKINGALSTSTHAKVLLINGAQAKNVFWKVDGATAINDFSEFKGTLVGNNGAISLKKGVIIDGRAFTTSGTISTDSVKVTANTSGCIPTGINSLTTEKLNAVSIYPNPFTESTNILLNDASQINKAELKMYNVLGEMVVNKTLTEKLTSIETSNLTSGIYVYKIFSNNAMIQSGKLISNK